MFKVISKACVAVTRLAYFPKTKRQENIAGDLFSNLTNAAAAASLALCASNLGRGVVTRSKPELIKQSEHHIGLDAHVDVEENEYFMNII